MDRTELTVRTGQVVDAAMRVHSALGPGLLESAYEQCLAYELAAGR
jgi:GxxExxY protein